MLLLDMRLSAAALVPQAKGKGSAEHPRWTAEPDEGRMHSEPASQGHSRVSPTVLQSVRHLLVFCAEHRQCSQKEVAGLSNASSLWPCGFLECSASLRTLAHGLACV